jgi:hypothetical protein
MTNAILYSGGLRTWNICKANQEQFIIKPSSDLYFFTDEQPENTSYKQFIKALPNPYANNPDHVFHTNRRPESEPSAGLNQMHNNFIGFSIVPNNYEVIIKSRTDIKISEALNYEDYEYTDNKIYIPTGNDYCGINDQFAWGNYPAMKVYFYVYMEMMNIFNAGVMYNPEIFQKANLERAGMEVIRTKHNVEIIR